MSREIDYTHADILRTMEHVQSARKSVGRERKSPALSDYLKDRVNFAVRQLAEVELALQAAEEACMAWKRAQGEVA